MPKEGKIIKGVAGCGQNNSSKTVTAQRRRLTRSRSRSATKETVTPDDKNVMATGSRPVKVRKLNQKSNKIDVVQQEVASVKAGPSSAGKNNNATVSDRRVVQATQKNRKAKGGVMETHPNIITQVKLPDGIDMMVDAQDDDFGEEDTEDDIDLGLDLNDQIQRTPEASSQLPSDMILDNTLSDAPVRQGQPGMVCG